MTPQERNAANLLHLWAEGEKLLSHKGTTIRDLDRLVDRVAGPMLRLELAQDRHLELGVCCYEEAFGDNSYQCQSPATIFDLESEFETCLKHFGKVGL